MSVLQQRLASVLIAVLAVSQAACESLVALAKVEQPARIVFYDKVASIEAPDTVARGAEFDVRFMSFESRCTDTPGHADVDARADSILIRPFVTASRSCGGDALLLLTHSVRVRADRSGSVSIHVGGRKERSGVVGDTVVTRRLFVR